MPLLPPKAERCSRQKMGWLQDSQYARIPLFISHMSFSEKSLIRTKGLLLFLSSVCPISVESVCLPPLAYDLQDLLEKLLGAPVNKQGCQVKSRQAFLFARVSNRSKQQVQKVPLPTTASSLATACWKQRITMATSKVYKHGTRLSFCQVFTLREFQRTPH